MKELAVTCEKNQDKVIKMQFLLESALPAVKEESSQSQLDKSLRLSKMNKIDAAFTAIDEITQNLKHISGK